MPKPVYGSAPDCEPDPDRCCTGCGRPLPAGSDIRRTTCDQACRTLTSLPTVIERALRDARGRLTPDMKRRYRSLLWRAANGLNEAQTQKTGRFVGHKRGNGRRGER